MSHLDEKILAVDDDPAALEALVDLLRSDGHAVDAARNGNEAQELLRHESYRLVVTDLVMPGKDGLELTALVRRSQPATPVVVVTGRPSSEDERAALQAGASEYLGKPLDPRTLRSLVTRLLHDPPPALQNRLAALGSRPSRPAIRAGGLEPGMIEIAIGTRMRDVEREVIVRTLDALGWNKNRTAQVLGISRRSLYNKLERFRILRPPLSSPLLADELIADEPAVAAPAMAGAGPEAGGEPVASAREARSARR